MSRVFAKPRYLHSSERTLHSAAIKSGNARVMRSILAATDALPPRVLREDMMDLDAAVASPPSIVTDDPPANIEFATYIELQRSRDVSDRVRAEMMAEDFTNGFIKWHTAAQLNPVMSSQALQDKWFSLLISRQFVLPVTLNTNGLIRMAAHIARAAVGKSIINTDVTAGASQNIAAIFNTTVGPEVAYYLSACDFLDKCARTTSSANSRVMFMHYANKKIRGKFLNDLLSDVVSSPAAGHMAIARPGVFTDRFMMHRFGSVLMASLDGTMYFCTVELLQDLANCMRSIAMSYLAIAFRDGNAPAQCKKMYRWLRRAIAWIHRNTVVSPAGCARHMHICFNAILQGAAENDAWAMDRVDALRTEAASFVSASPDWYELCGELPYRDAMDVAKMYHIIPPREINPQMLCDKVCDAYNDISQKPTPPEHLASFLAFCRAFDIARSVTKFKRRVTVLMNGHTIPPETAWYEACIRGRETLPPEEDWSSLSMASVLEYVPYGNSWHLKAGDVTHVSHDRKVSNEMLYTLEHGDTLSCGHRLAALRSDPVAHAHRHTVYAAGKSENTKSDRKVRETLSANDCFREMFSEIDLNARRFGRIMPGFMVARDAQKTEKIFQMMASKTRDSTHTCASSHDVSSWSTNMRRDLLIAHHKLVMSYFVGAPSESVWEWWNRIDVMFSKAGVSRIAHARTGSFQGFTGSLDTILHIHLMLYCFHLARKAGIATKNHRATIAAMIDDCTFIVEGDAPFTTAAKKVWFEHLVGTYAVFGLEIDPVKSVISSNKFIFLNRIFINGTEVVQPVKVMMKCGRSIVSPYAGMLEHISTIMTSASAAASCGMDPLGAYMCALCVVLLNIQRFHSTFLQLPPSVVATIVLSPRTFGGLGVPRIASWITREITDPTTDFLYQWAALPHGDMKRNAGRLVNRPNAIVDDWVLVSDPMKIRKIDIVDVDAPVKSALLHAVERLQLSDFWKFIYAGSEIDNIRSQLSHIARVDYHSALYLSELAALSPAALRDEYCTKMIRSGAIAKIIPRSSRSRLLNTVDRMSRRVIDLAVHILNTTPDAPDLTMSEDVFDKIRDMKDEFMGYHQMAMADLVIPPPSTVVVPAGRSDTSPIGVYVKPFTRVDGTMFSPMMYPESFGNNTMYVKTSSPWHKLHTAVALADVFEQRYVEGSALLHLALEDQYPVTKACAWFAAAWGLPDLAHVINEQHISVKRVPTRYTQTSHSARLMPTAQSHVAVSGGALFAHLTGTVMNPFGIICEARASILFNVCHIAFEAPQMVSFMYSMRHIPRIEEPREESMGSLEPVRPFHGGLLDPTRVARVVMRGGDASASVRYSDLVIMQDKTIDAFDKNPIVFYPERPPTRVEHSALTDDLRPIPRRVDVDLPFPNKAALRGRLAALARDILSPHKYMIEQAVAQVYAQPAIANKLSDGVHSALLDTGGLSSANLKTLHDVGILRAADDPKSYQKTVIENVNPFFEWAKTHGIRGVSAGVAKYGAPSVVPRAEVINIVQDVFATHADKMEARARASATASASRRAGWEQAMARAVAQRRTTANPKTELIMALFAKARKIICRIEMYDDFAKFVTNYDDWCKDIEYHTLSADAKWVVSRARIMSEWISQDVSAIDSDSIVLDTGAVVAPTEERDLTDWAHVEALERAAPPPLPPFEELYKHKLRNALVTYPTNPALTGRLKKAGAVGKDLYDLVEDAIVKGIEVKLERAWVDDSIDPRDLDQPLDRESLTDN